MAVSTAIESVSDVESFIKEYYDAWSGTDLDRIMSYYSDDVVLQIPRLLMEGKEAVRNQFARPFTTAFPGNRHFVKNMIFGPGVVTVEFSFEAEHKGSFAGHAATGARISLPGCGVYEYDPAKRHITAGRIYFDFGTLQQTITNALVDDRQKSEEALQASWRNLTLTLNTIPTLIAVLLPDGTILSSNQAALDYHGVTMEEVQKEDFRTRFYHPDDWERLREELKDALNQPRQFEYELRALSNAGEYRWFLVRCNPLLDDQGRIDRWYVAAFDIEDRKRAEDALVRQAGVRADVSAAFSQPIDLGEILRGCTEAIVRHLDAAFARIWTLSKDESTLELQASSGMYTRLDGSYSRIPVGDLKVGLIAREKKAHFTNDVMNDPRVHDKGWAQNNGMIAFAGYPLLVEDRLVGVVALFARRTLSESILDTLASVADTIAQGIERKRAEEALTSARSELAHMARVTTLSALTASIAHEVNQPISAVTTSAGACLRWLNRDQPDVQRAREAAMRIEDDGRRAAEIISHLRSFYKKDVSPQRGVVSINELVAEMLMLLRSEADRHSVLMRTDLATDLPPVKADPVLLQQVLMNLMLNGMEAMSDRGGELKISTRRKDAEAKVSVSDTGAGIPADKMEEIFKAFVTTKIGGTGMGLAISRTIIESHGGRLWADTNPESGATFHFTLPN